MTQQLTLRDPWLSAGTLVRFAGNGITWPEILALDTTKRKAWWTRAIIEAEERGYLIWNSVAKTYRLSDAGREHTRGIS